MRASVRPERSGSEYDRGMSGTNVRRSRSSSWKSSRPWSLTTSRTASCHGLRCGLLSARARGLRSTASRGGGGRHAHAFDSACARSARRGRWARGLRARRTRRDKSPDDDRHRLARLVAPNAGLVHPLGSLARRRALRLEHEARLAYPLEAHLRHRPSRARRSVAAEGSPYARSSPPRPPSPRCSPRAGACAPPAA